jgi:hypothetical protein
MFEESGFIRVHLGHGQLDIDAPGGIIDEEVR